MYVRGVVFYASASDGKLIRVFFLKHSIILLPYNPHVILKIFKVDPYTIYSRVFSIGLDLINFLNYIRGAYDFYQKIYS